MDNYAPSPYRESSLGYLLWSHGWRPEEIIRKDEKHPRWSKGDDTLTASEALTRVFAEMRTDEARRFGLEG